MSAILMNLKISPVIQLAANKEWGFKLFVLWRINFPYPL